MKKISILIIVALFIISGCGYTTKSVMLPYVRTIYIEPVRSNIDLTKEEEYGDHYRIYRPGLERDITKAVKDRFIFDGNLKVVTDRNKADTELVCEIIDFTKEPLQYTDSDTVDEYRLKIIISMKFMDITHDAVLIEEKSFVGETTYTLSGTLAKSESAAQSDAIKDLATRIVERIVENW